MKNKKETYFNGSILLLFVFLFTFVFFSFQSKNVLASTQGWTNEVYQLQPNSANCKSNNDCASGVCGNGICVACASDSNCPSGEICSSYKECIQPQSNNGCPAGESLDTAGQCVNTANAVNSFNNTIFKCSSDQDCPTGDFCDTAGECVNTADAVNQMNNTKFSNELIIKCSTDQECPVGYSCSAGHCSSSQINSNSGFPTPASAVPRQPSSSPAANASSSGAYNVANGIYIPQMGLPSSTVQSVLMSLLQWLLGIVGIIALISFIISGIQYFAAAGDETRVESAKRTMTYSIIGVIIVFASYVIIHAINLALQAKTIF